MQVKDMTKTIWERGDEIDIEFAQPHHDTKTLERAILLRVEPRILFVGDRRTGHEYSLRARDIISISLLTRQEERY